MYFTVYLPGKLYMISQYTREGLQHNLCNHYWPPFTNILQQFMVQGFQNQNRMGCFGTIWTSPVVNQPQDDQPCQELPPKIHLTNVSNQIHLDLVEQHLISVMFLI